MYEKKLLTAILPSVALTLPTAGFGPAWLWVSFATFNARPFIFSAFGLFAFLSDRRFGRPLASSFGAPAGILQRVCRLSQAIASFSKSSAAK